MEDINLSIESLSFAINRQDILDNINLNLQGVQAVTLLGPNGAGKSTLLKAIAAHLQCPRGEIKLNGVSANTHRLSYMQNIGYMPEQAMIIPELNVKEQLQLMAKSKALEPSAKDFQRVIDLCQLNDVMLKRSCQLSLGFKQRLNLAQALLNSPTLLIMDEPLNGLDPHLIIEFRNIIKQLKKHSLIIISTHYLAEAQTISDRIIIMQKGKILDDIDVKQQPHDFNLEDVYLSHTRDEVVLQ
jgi:ABC-2 type transport system ATP-binding protein